MQRRMKPDTAALFHRAFQLGIILKGLDGVLEMIGGAALLLTTRPEIGHVITLLTRAELIEDPRDFIANHVVHLSQQVSVGTQHFAGVYLLAHGLIKIGLVSGLLRGLRWSYPTALLFLTSFIVYQLYRLLHSQSILLCFLTVLDCAIVILIWREWRQAKKS